MPLALIARTRAGRLGLAAALAAMAFGLTRQFWPFFQHTPMVLSFGAAVLCTRLGGRESGFATVLFGILLCLAFPPPVTRGVLVVLLVGFSIVSSTFTWIVARRDEIEAALRAREAQLAESQQIANLGSWEMTIADRKEVWSDQAYRVLGVEPGTMSPTFENFVRFVHPDDRAIVDRSMAQALADRRPFSWAFRIVRPDGEVRTLHVQGRVVTDERGEPLRMIGTAQDITDRTASAEALQRSERRLKTIIDAEPACVKLVSPEGLLLEMNPAGLQMLGVSDLSQVAGHAVVDVVHPDHRDRYLDAHRAASAGRPGRIEFQIVGLTGEMRWVDSLLVPFDVRADAPDVPHRVLSVTSDITERKQLEEQLRQAQKMEAIGRLSGGIAHDFNNLLTAIGGLTEMALVQLDERSPIAADLREVLKASHSAAALTRQLLLFSRKQALPTAPVDLNAIIANIRELLRRTIGEDIRVRIRLSPDLQQISGDVAQLQQVIMNLAVNARDAMPRGGSIEIETDRVVLVGPAAHTLNLAAGAYVTLKFSDTGHGMDADTKARAFESFFTTKGRGLGTGLGLSSVYGIIRSLNGAITIDSEVGRGTTFKLYFPESSLQERVVEPHPMQPGAHTGSETIVLVEDDDRVRTFSSRVLRSAGYNVIDAGSPSQALKFIQRDGEKIDALLTDVIMPEMDGVELARRVREVRPGTRVLYMSGYTDEVFQEHQLSMEGELLIEKPFTAAGLLRRMRDALGPSVAQA
jgi:PAS domain S-box-containing protein